jgi:membrane glycosyltransferase
MALRRLGLLLTPEEEGPPAIVREFQAVHAQAIGKEKAGIRALAEDAALREAHFRWVNPSPRRRGAPDPAYLTAAHKIAEAETLDEALEWLDARECVQVAGEEALAERLARLSRPAPPLPDAPPIRSAVA